ncbi:MAG: argininosuccinate lyase [Desulfuromonadales bacterium]|nr:argininosuccinate lyase [Desulfuromonadales bacterium]
MTDKLWGGRFSQPTDAFVEAFTASIQFDQRLYRYDIQGSIAHCRMLARQKIIAGDEADAIIAGLTDILDEIESGAFTFRVDREDIHMNIEARLIEKIGPVGGKLHTARSRNDQVALDVRLYLRDEIDAIRAGIVGLLQALLQQAEGHLDVIMPGYTHLQTAQPVLFAHHLLAYVEMFQRDAGRLNDLRKRLNLLPLGAGALAGTTFPIDREWVAAQLGFDGVTRNSLDSVSDRDFAIEFNSFAALLMMHLSRLSEELILWSSADFAFVELSDAFCTGSSIMPQKKNPDVPELVRGKTGRVYGNLISLLTLMKSLPLAYNKDMQEDKEPLFDTIDTVRGSLKVFAPMIAGMTISPERMRLAAGRGYSTATDIADYLVRKGLPFRQAHEVVGKTVRYCVETGKDLDQLTLDEFRRFSADIDTDIFACVTLEASVDARAATGGTARSAVQREIALARQAVAELEA